MVIEYADLECPYCAKAHLILRDLPITRVFRHFPVTSKHPRARGCLETTGKWRNTRRTGSSSSSRCALAQ